MLLSTTSSQGVTTDCLQVDLDGASGSDLMVLLCRNLRIVHSGLTSSLWYAGDLGCGAADGGRLWAGAHSPEC